MFLVLELEINNSFLILIAFFYIDKYTNIIRILNQHFWIYLLNDDLMLSFVKTK